MTIAPPEADLSWVTFMQEEPDDPVICVTDDHEPRRAVAAFVLPQCEPKHPICRECMDLLKEQIRRAASYSLFEVNCTTHQTRRVYLKMPVRIVDL